MKNEKKMRDWEDVYDAVKKVRSAMIHVDSFEEPAQEVYLLLHKIETLIEKKVHGLYEEEQK